jgi:uncharacterized damage-inducible protein DinB
MVGGRVLSDPPVEANMNAEQARLLVETFAGLMENEVPLTCKVLAAVSNGDGDYKPDAKARSARELAAHMAVSDNWFLQSIIDGRFEFDQAASEKAEAQFKSTDEIAAFYQKTVPEKLKTLRALPDETLAREVDFFGMMKLPVVSYLGLANNHSVHHRGQLAAYLRPMGSKVPAIYGGSADEPMQAAAS